MTVKDTIITIIVVIGILAIIITPFAVLMYETDMIWSDTGHVNWIGEKQFNPGMNSPWSIPFSVHTKSHGDFNFTTTRNYFNCWFGAPVNTNVTLGILAGITQNRLGCTVVTIDP